MCALQMANSIFQSHFRLWYTKMQTNLHILHHIVAVAIAGLEKLDRTIIIEPYTPRNGMVRMHTS